jgi:hypothetical protein
MLPDKSFKEKSNNCSCERLDKDDGIFQVNLLKEKSKVVSWLRLDKDAGMLPVS